MLTVGAKPYPKRTTFRDILNLLRLVKRVWYKMNTVQQKGEL